MKCYLSGIFLTLLFWGCQPKGKYDKELHDLSNLLSGSFTSQEQSKTNIGYANFTLKNQRIWKKSPGFWFYSEIHSTDKPYKVYLQRILNISRIDSITLKSVGYTILRNREDYINGWEEPLIFDKLSIDSLKIKEGCDIYYRQKSPSIYIGKTKEGACKSTFKNISYFSSNVVVSPDLISIWDRGYDTENKQVFGKINKPYKYKRISDN